jgi:hypothetical protein
MGENGYHSVLLSVRKCRQGRLEIYVVRRRLSSFIVHTIVMHCMALLCIPAPMSYTFLQCGELMATSVTYSSLATTGPTVHVDY